MPHLPINATDLAGLSEPATRLIEKISDAMGVLWKPSQIKRIAQAEVEAAMIKAQGEIEITDLTRRAAQRWIAEQTQYQQNMESITAAALPNLNENADPGSMENDWLVNFFDKGRKISDDEMQGLWARILSGEANVPGSFSKRTVNCVAELNQSDAELFTSLCGFMFVWQNSDQQPRTLIFDHNAEIYNNNGVNFGTLHHLESIGLIRTGMAPFSSFRHTNLPKHCVAIYHGRPLALELPNDTDNTIMIGSVFLTLTGVELASICPSQPVDGFWEYVKDKWKEYLPKSYPA